MNSYKLENLEEIDKFWETYTLSRLKQEKIEKLNNTVKNKEIQILIKKKKIQKIKSLGPNGFKAQFYQHSSKN
jgi:hypothetical protein